MKRTFAKLGAMAAMLAATLEPSQNKNAPQTLNIPGAHPTKYYLRGGSMPSSGTRGKKKSNRLALKKQAKIKRRLKAKGHGN